MEKEPIKLSKEAIELMSKAKSIELACEALAGGIKLKNDEVVFNLIVSKTTKVAELQAEFWNLIYKDNPDYVGSTLTYSHASKKVSIWSSLNTSMDALFSELKKRLLKENLMDLALDVRQIQDKYKEY